MPELIGTVNGEHINKQHFIEIQFTFWKHNKIVKLTIVEPEKHTRHHQMEFKR